MKNKKQTGITLNEIMVIAAIIGIVAALIADGWGIECKEGFSVKSSKGNFCAYSYKLRGEVMEFTTDQGKKFIEVEDIISADYPD